MILNLMKVYVTCIMIQLVGARSFTVVLDTTKSMLVEMDIIRRNMVKVADVLGNATDFENFIVVPFNHLSVSRPIISTSPDRFVESLSGITVSGGRTCPEDTLSGIQEGLEVSKPESLVYVFTDAYANDVSKIRSIETLCKNLRSQVVIFLSGNCPGDSWQRGNVDVYYEIAKVCSGAVLKFDSITLNNAYKYINEMITADWNDVISLEPFTEYKDTKITVDTFTRDIIIVVSGDRPSLRVDDGSGHNARIQNIIETRQSLVVRVLDIKSGVYQVSVWSQGATSFTIYKRTQLPFEYGFSTRLPRSLRETSLRPIPGWINYILIVLSPAFNIEITSLELLMTDTDDKKSLPLNESERHGYYVSSVFMEPEKSFRCVIHGKDSLTDQEIIGSTKVVDVQKSVSEIPWFKPYVEIIEPDTELIDFGTDTTLACKVKGYPKPEIQWTNDQDVELAIEEVLLEIPSTFISYVTFNATSNSTVNCKAVNAKGSEDLSLDLFVNRTFTFEIVQIPRDESFEYQTEGKLYCQIEAYPEIEVKWYHNGTEIENSYNIEVIPSEYSLVIKNMSLDDVGTYLCEVKNYVRSENYSAEVTISGLEAPEVELENTEIILQPGDWKTIECRVRGNPQPEISWKYQPVDGFSFDDSFPEDVYVEEQNLKILGKNEHKGTYKCVASNIMGEDSKEVTVKLQYKPIIRYSEDTVSVMELNQVELRCDVDAVPEAVVRWEMTQDDVIVPLDHRHSTNSQNTHRFLAEWRDSGNYHCIAENNLGKVEKTVVVNVLVPPFIRPPESRRVEAFAGSDVTLPCAVLYGNPAPSTKWTFIPRDAASAGGLRQSATNSQLQLNNVSRANEGMYLCIAENSVGNDRIKIDLKIK